MNDNKISINQTILNECEPPVISMPWTHGSKPIAFTKNAEVSPPYLICTMQKGRVKILHLSCHHPSPYPSGCCC